MVSISNVRNSDGHIVSKQSVESNEDSNDNVETTTAIIDTTTDVIDTTSRDIRVTFMDQIGIIGGTLGLFTGVSMISILDFISYIYKLIFIGIHRNSSESIRVFRNSKSIFVIFGID